MKASLSTIDGVAGKVNSGIVQFGEKRRKKRFIATLAFAISAATTLISSTVNIVNQADKKRYACRSRDPAQRLNELKFFEKIQDQFRQCEMPNTHGGHISLLNFLFY